MFNSYFRKIRSIHMTKSIYSFQMPWEMDLAELRGSGVKEGETLLPDVTTDVPEPQYNKDIMSLLVT